MPAATEAAERAERAEAEARKPLEEAERELQRVSAEAKALSDLLRPEGQDLWPPLVDAVKVEPGYETALAVALGDDLQAPLDISAPHHWRDLGTSHELAPLPAGQRAADPLCAGAAGADAAPDNDRADRSRMRATGCRSQLKPGQRLVSQRGDLWRWDGYSASADAPSAAAVRLAQRNRLEALESEIEAAKATRANLFEAYSRAKAVAAEARMAVRDAEDTLRQAEAAQRRADQALIAAQGEAAKAAARSRRARLAAGQSRSRNPPPDRDTRDRRGSPKRQADRSPCAS